MGLAKNLQRILEEIAEAAKKAGRRPDDIKLVAVSKGRSVEEILEAYHLGIKDFGENRVAEALAKIERLPGDIRWHFIGKLQKNKVRKVVGRFALIHSVDTLEVAQRISQVSDELKIKTAILLEANISGEAAKSGLSAEEWENKFPELLRLPGIQIEGLMTMAPLTENKGEIQRCFAGLHCLRQRLVEKGGNLTTLSMGMSHDFALAIQEGATLVRIGTALFATP